MWTYQHSETVNASPSVIWPLYADVSQWPSWDEQMERVDLDGPFIAGTAGVMHIANVGPVPFVFTVVEPNARFANVSDLNGVSITFDHTLVADGNRTVITHAVTIDGPAADQVGPQMGPSMTSDIPDSMASVARLAESMK
jgi:Polyketide cyclase / dehydrase and lipid transport